MNWASAICTSVLAICITAAIITMMICDTYKSTHDYSPKTQMKTPGKK